LSRYSFKARGFWIMKKLSFLDTSKDTVTALTPARICMHVLTVARTDVRVMREATALVEAGFAVSIVDVEAGDNRPLEENDRGVWMKHILMPSSFLSTRFTKWALVRA